MSAYKETLKKGAEEFAAQMETDRAGLFKPGTEAISIQNPMRVVYMPLISEVNLRDFEAGAACQRELDAKRTEDERAVWIRLNEPNIAKALRNLADDIRSGKPALGL